MRIITVIITDVKKWYLLNPLFIVYKDEDMKKQGGRLLVSNFDLNIHVIFNHENSSWFAPII